MFNLRFYLIYICVAIFSSVCWSDGVEYSNLSYELSHKNSYLINKKLSDIYRSNPYNGKIINMLYFYWPRYYKLSMLSEIIIDDSIDSIDSIDNIVEFLLKEGVIKLSGGADDGYISLRNEIFEYLIANNVEVDEKFCFINKIISGLMRENKEQLKSETSLIYENIPRITSEQCLNKCISESFNIKVGYLEYLVTVKKNYKHAMEFYKSIALKGDENIVDVIKYYNSASSLFHWLGDIEQSINIQERIISLLKGNDNYSGEMIRSKIYLSSFYCSKLHLEKSKKIFYDIPGMENISEDIPRIYNEILYNELKSDINRREGHLIASYLAIKNAINISKKLAVYSLNEEHLFLSTYLLYLKKWMLEAEIGGEFNTLEEAEKHFSILKKTQLDGNHRFNFMTQIIILYFSETIVSTQEIKALEGKISNWYSKNINMAEVYDLYLYMSMIASASDNLMLSRYYLLNAYYITTSINSDDKIKDDILTRIAKNFYITGDIGEFLHILDGSPKIAINLYRSV